jgi:hypothetical protein
MHSGDSYFMADKHTVDDEVEVGEDNQGHDAIGAHQGSQYSTPGVEKPVGNSGSYKDVGNVFGVSSCASQQDPVSPRPIGAQPAPPQS